MDSELAGKTVLVTGASGGIGSAIARSFAAEGAKVVLHYHRNRASAAALLREFRPGQAIAFGADLTKQAPVKKLFAAAGKHFGGVDVLVANAGDWEMRDVPVHQKELKQWQATFDGVLTSAFLCLREFLGMVEKQKRGNAVLIASTAGIFGEANHADYAAAKSAMAVGLLKSVKNEIARLAPHTRDYCGGRIKLRLSRLDAGLAHGGKAARPGHGAESGGDDGASQGGPTGRHRQRGHVFCLG